MFYLFILPNSTQFGSDKRLNVFFFTRVVIVRKACFCLKICFYATFWVAFDDFSCVVYIYIYIENLFFLFRILLVPVVCVIVSVTTSLGCFSLCCVGEGVFCFPPRSTSINRLVFLIYINGIKEQH